MNGTAHEIALSSSGMRCCTVQEKAGSATRVQAGLPLVAMVFPLVLALSSPFVAESLESFFAFLPTLFPCESSKA